MVVEFHQNAKGFTRGDKAAVAEDENGLYLQKQDGTRAAVPVGQAKRFDVYRTRDVAIAKGDRIRITNNGEAKVEGQAKGTRLNNGDIFTVEGFTKEGDIRLGKGKLLPKGFGHFALGYVDTSYASQGKTVDRVFIAAGSESLPGVESAAMVCLRFARAGDGEDLRRGQEGGAGRHRAAPASASPPWN